MREHAVSEGRELASAVEQLADRFAAKWTGSVHDRQVRELTHEFLFDVVDTLRRASIVEIAEALAALERDKARISAAARRPLERVRDRDRADERTKRTGAVAEEPELAPLSPDASRKSRDPFDITKPGELLEPTSVETRRDDDLPPSSERRASASRAESTTGVVGMQTTRRPAATPQRTVEAVRPQPPAVTLREGEQLLRTGGSGVVIRRARIA
jgi:hypothetical protein